MANSTKYVRKTVRIEISESASYANPLVDETFTEEYTADTFKRGAPSAASGGKTVDLSEFSDVEDLVLVNKDASVRFDTTHRTGTTAGTANDQGARVDAGRIVCLGDVTPGNDIVLTGNSADVEVEYIAIGDV